MPRVLPPAPSTSPQALLQLLWLASPALPVGGFSYSEGLEAAIDTGRVQGEADALAWLVDQLHLSLARADLAVVAQAHAAWARHDTARLHELNDWVRLTRESQELRQQTEQMGRSLLEWLRTLERQRLEQGESADERVATLATLKPAPSWPVAWALAVQRSGAPLREALLTHAFGWAENMVQAAIKAVPLGQSAGQRMLARLVQEIPPAVEHTMALPDSARQAHSPMLAILSARHEQQYSRLFRS
ncbi:urease accessory protein [Sphaerotilus hippei]|uniref:Urease accessory protein UreF n=1 Tax=Sphaerotilus hippei TaxID=744406 RepID=A0A318GZB9_9BURK|nr:urease accessory UreF family protein [Sphaerotilus hippei]PXW92877.1 urease accessory protein [Sphaerotilus hippei]